MPGRTAHRLPTWVRSTLVRTLLLCPDKREATALLQPKSQQPGPPSHDTCVQGERTSERSLRPSQIQSLISDKGTKATQGSKDSIFNRRLWSHRMVPCRKLNLARTPTPAGAGQDAEPRELPSTVPGMQKTAGWFLTKLGTHHPIQP